MADFATSDDPAVQAQLDRLGRLSPGADILGLGRITALLERLGNPQHRLPPVFHVAGTNGKGSTCAVLRAALESDGYRVHAYTSPHLVRFNERIRLAGRLIEDAALAPLLAHVLDAGGDLGASFFEVTTAAALLAFAETPADAVVLEVGLGGRLDATNVIASPAACGIAQLAIDHEAFLGSDPVGIAREKAGIARPGRPLVTRHYPFDIRDAVAEVAAAADAKLLRESVDWDFIDLGDQLRVIMGARAVTVEASALAGRHQAGNAALAIAMLMSQQVVPVSDAALAAAPRRSVWPGRLQRLDPGPLTALAPQNAPVWLDGGHNPAAGEALAASFALDDRLHIVCGMLANKDAAGFLAPLASRMASFTAVPVDGHACHDPVALAAEVSAMTGVPSQAAPDVAAALAAINQRGDALPVLICGSLYLAGVVLRLNQQLPD